MADKRVQIKLRNAQNEFDNIYPKTKMDLVEGLQTALDNKVDKVEGKQLSTEDYTTTEKQKLAGIEVGANNYIHPTSAGNKHIPSGGATGQVLKYGGSSGTAAWGNIAESELPTISTSKISGLGTAATKNIGTAVGNVPVLGDDGKLDASVLPAIAITDTFVVNSESAMLALDAQVGDIAVRTDLQKSFILKAAPASTLSNWQELLNPVSPVQSVNGKTGTVVLSKSDVGLGSVENYGIATQVEAEDGTPNNKYMTPLRVKQAIDEATINLGSGDMLKSVYDADNDGKVDVAKTAESVAWSNVTGKPTTFTPSSHTHTAADLPKASTSAQGIVQLIDSYTSTSTSLVPTANSLKQVYEIANSKSKVFVGTTQPTDADIWFEIL